MGTNGTEAMKAAEWLKHIASQCRKRDTDAYRWMAEHLEDMAAVAASTGRLPDLADVFEYIRN